MKSGWANQYVRYRAYLLSTATRYKQRRSVQMYFELLLSLATISIFAIFALRPTLLTIAELLKSIDSKEKTIAILDTKLENLTTASQIFRSQRKNVNLLNLSVPEGSMPENLIRQLEGLSSKHSVEVLSVSVENTLLVGSEIPKASSDAAKQFPSGSNQLSFSINTGSNYLALSGYLKDLEKLRRPIKIDRLTFRVKGEGDNNKLTLTVSSRTPFVEKDVK